MLDRELILKGKDGGTEAVETLFLLFSPLLEKQSRVYGVPDEDLRAEQDLAFLKCLKQFSIEESAFVREFLMWEAGNNK